MNHPNALDLQAFACGDDVPPVASHVTICGACAAYVARVAGVAKAEKAPTPRAVLNEAATPAASSVTSLASRRTKMALAAAPFAIAAAALLWMSTRAPATAVATSTALPSAALLPPSAVAANDAVEPETTFKGGLQVAVVRDRRGVQDRTTSVVKVRPGDRLRIEVAIDRSQTLLGAVVGEDGSYVEIMPAAVREGGTYFSERSTRVDEHPLRGLIVVGSPDAVRLARTTRDFSGVRTIPIEWEATP